MLVCAAVVLLAAAGGWLWLRTSLPERSGTIALAGLAAPVEIVRDRHGIPHIRAGDMDDAYFALGFVHAQDRLFQMEFMRRLGAGRLSEVLGPRTVTLDRRMRVLGLYRLAEGTIDRLAPEVRRSIEAYARGVNAYLATHRGVLAPELALLGDHPEPWRPADSLVWARMMALRLSGNWRTEALRARLAERLTPDQLDAFWPATRPEAPPTLATAGRPSLPPGLGPEFARLLHAWPAVLAPITASNSWGVAGRLTETGRPILANDPHLGYRVPGLWYLARIETPGLTLTGATVPGVPFTILGHNGTVAWAFTMTESDTQDLFVEKVDPTDPSRYLGPDGPLPFAVRNEVIHVRGAPDVTVKVRETRHGPVVSDLDPRTGPRAAPGEVVALAATALAPDDVTAEAVWRLNRAKSWEAFTDALSKFQSPQENITYADTAGNIGFIAPGRVPIRRSGDGMSPVPGWTGDHDWTGFIPYEDLPRTLNPASGEIVNANQPIVGPGYPYWLGYNGTPPYRARRIYELLAAAGPQTLARSAAMQSDIVSLAARDLLPLMTRIEGGSDRAKAALALLKGWDGRMDRDRPEPLIFTAWLRELNRGLYGDETGDLFRQMWRLRPVFVHRVLTGATSWCDDARTARRETCDEQLRAALERAVAALAEAYGDTPAEWRWGRAHEAHFRHPLFGWLPIVNRLSDIRVAVGGGAFTLNREQPWIADDRAPYTAVHGPGYRAIYDLADLDRSLFVIATGQSGNLLSPRYSDFNALWRAGKYVTITSLDGAPPEDVEDTLHLVPKR